MKARSGNFNFSKTTPTKVSEMKEGEWRLTDGGIYARIGDQILQKDLSFLATGLIATYWYVGGQDQGHILRSTLTSAGEVWEDMGWEHSENQEGIGAVASCGNGIWLAVTQWTESHVLKSIDNGFTWIDKGTPFESYEILDALEHLENGIVLASPYDPYPSHMYRSINYGESWSDLGEFWGGSTSTEIIRYLEDGMVLAGGDDGTLRFSSDYGATWSAPYEVYQYVGGFEDIIYLGNGLVMAFTDYGVYKSWDYGLHYHKNRGYVNYTPCTRGVYLGGGIVVAADSGDDIEISTDYGDTFTNEGAMTGVNNPRGMARLGDNIIVAVNYSDNHVIRSIDGGYNWTDLGAIFANLDSSYGMASDMPRVLDGVDSGIRYCVGSNADGSVDNGGSVWSTVHDATTGTSKEDDAGWGARPYVEDSGGGAFVIRRVFFDFNLQIPSSKVVVAAELWLRGWNPGGSSCDLAIQQGTHAIPLTVDDFDSFTGGLLANEWTGFDMTDWNYIAFNSTGLAYLNSLRGDDYAIAKLCVREHDHDYLNVQIGDPETVYSGFYMTDSEYKPYLKLTLADA